MINRMRVATLFFFVHIADPLGGDCPVARVKQRIGVLTMTLAVSKRWAAMRKSLA